MSTPTTQDFTEAEEQAAITKLAVTVKLLDCVCGVAGAVKKLKNHPIHGYTGFLSDLVIGTFTSRQELEYLILEAKEYRKDFKRSRNTWVKQRTATVVDLMQEIINGNFEIPKLALDLLEEAYPFPEVKEVDIKTKKFSHVVLSDTKCPSCSHVFKSSEIKEFVEIGYRCPKCRQVIRMK
jgi:predicted Zn-ribbon and HTH transcriptional regulator